MSRPPQKAVFLERTSYRQRRLRDAARVLPLLGVILWMVPLLWPADVAATDMSAAVIYTFFVWVILIVLSAVISLRLRSDDQAPTLDNGD